MRSRVTGHEGNGPDGYVGLEQFLGSDDWPNGIGVQMESELVERSTSESVHAANKFTWRPAEVHPRCTL